MLDRYEDIQTKLADLSRSLAFLRAQELMEEVKIFDEAPLDASVASINRLVRSQTAVIKQQIIQEEGEYQALLHEAKALERKMDAAAAASG